MTWSRFSYVCLPCDAKYSAAATITNARYRQVVSDAALGAQQSPLRCPSCKGTLHVEFADGRRTW